jgi:hypothetical protein
MCAAMSPMPALPQYHGRVPGACRSLKASLAGRRIASVRVRTGPFGPTRRQRPPQRCDASGPTRPA